MIQEELKLAMEDNNTADEDEKDNSMVKNRALDIPGLKFYNSASVQK